MVEDMEKWHWVPSDPTQRNPAACGDRRGPYGQVTCELPSGHTASMYTLTLHYGRTRAGSWVYWVHYDQ